MAENGKKGLKLKKNKHTLFSSTFKVEESKVVLFFTFGAIQTTFLPFFGIFEGKIGLFSIKGKLSKWNFSKSAK